MHQHDVERAAPAWLTDGGTEDEVLGLLKTGKEAEVFIVERRTLDGSRSELLAHKRYRPTKVTHKGELQALGFSRARTFAHDAKYHEGRKFRYSREQRAVERMTDLGKKILAERWPGQELDTLVTAHDAGVTVPVPGGVHRRRPAHAADRRRRRRGAPPRERAPRCGAAARRATSSSSTDLRALTRTGTVHADLSPYNLLWWRERLWMIDFPQAVDLLQNPHGFDLLHHDVITMTTWFSRKGVPCDGEALYAELLADAF